MAVCVSNPDMMGRGGEKRVQVKGLACVASVSGGSVLHYCRQARLRIVDGDQHQGLIVTGREKKGSERCSL